MNIEPFTIERTFDVPAVKVWKAISDKENMKKWCFDIADFKPEKDFEFRFLAGNEKKKYLHVCRITEVVPGKKLSYSWCFDGYEGMSIVTFELFEETNQTRLKLTHKGLETFPSDNRDFAKESFAEGWTYIIGTSLKQFVEQ